MIPTDNNIKHKTEHQEVWELLPWYINRSLNAIEENRVKTHAKDCIACKIELNQQYQIVEKMQQDTFLQQTAQISFSKLKQRIENQSNISPRFAENPEKEQKGLGFFYSNFFRLDHVKFFGYVALLAGLLITVSSLFHIPSDLLETTNVYRTLGSSSDVTHQKGNLIHVVFADSATSKQINDVISGVSGQIIKGPSKNGVYEIWIDEQPINKHEFNGIVNRLRNHKLIVFAEPTQGTD
jgi:hypothetical protein